MIGFRSFHTHHCVSAQADDLPFSSELLEGQPMDLSFDTGFVETRLLFPVEVQPTDHFVLCQHLYSLNSQVAKSVMPNGSLELLQLELEQAWWMGPL